ncbi:MAG: FtsQ-type POTRA domain-containing protein [Acidobacteria bacterium]|nr:FtsQ-type POTRA domain-containing protein [Acidobacteriota bacterium]
MARKTEPASEGRGRLGPGVRVTAILLGVAGLGVVAMIAFGWLEQHLIRNPRFVFAGPSDYGEESPNLTLRGLKHSSREQVSGVFQRDFGRSVYLFPVAERRRNLLAIPWVRDVRVMRIWPDRVEAEIVERVPAAFVQVLGAPGQAARFAMIDEDGVLLESSSAAQFRLPVVVGLPVDAGISVRRDRIHRVERLVKKFGKLIDQVSEIDVSEPDNLKVSTQMDHRVIVLELGNQHFLLRFNGFINHYPRIKDRLPNASTFDLRLEDRITAVGGSSSVQ